MTAAPGLTGPCPKATQPTLSSLPRQASTAIINGLVKAESISDYESVAINTWGVDFVFLDTNGEIITQPVSYRDSRTESILDEMLNIYLNR